jgi:hypothetical protein
MNQCAIGKVDRTCRAAGGRIAEAETVVDMLSLMQQIGAIPTPSAAKA